jgi:type IV pilus assembly protein PilC
MATATTATATAKKESTETLYSWTGTDKGGKTVRGEMRASSEAVVNATLRQKGVKAIKVSQPKSGRFGRSQSISEKDITLFTRMLSTMLKAGVPLLQSFDIVGKGQRNLALQKLLMDVKTNVETGSTLRDAFEKHPLYFDSLFCSLVGAGEQAGILDTLLDRLATYKEKILFIKGKIKSALVYPVAIVSVAFIITAVIMIFVIPAFKQVYSNFGADLPGLTLVVIAISDFFVSYWYLIFGIVVGGVGGFFYFWKRSKAMQIFMDRVMLRLPIIGEVVRKATIARWTRTLSTMFAAGVPLVDALGSVAGAAGNHEYLVATKAIQSEVATGTSLVLSMQNTDVFPNMVLQMVTIGEEAGTLDAMLAKAADYYEGEVDDAVASMSSLMEPVIMAVLGTLIGGLVVAMYLPIFKLGQVV